MKTGAIVGSIPLAVFVLSVFGCETTPAVAPPITPSFLQAGTRQNADGRTLGEGRRLYLNRCIVCHALPRVAKYDPQRLTVIVAKMASRANLNEEQHTAVLKYLLTARSL